MLRTIGHTTLERAQRQQEESEAAAEERARAVLAAAAVLALALDRGRLDDLSRTVGPARLRRDGRLAVRAAWKEPEARLAGVGKLVRCLAHRDGDPAPRSTRRPRRVAT
jgi:hypothetical protein